MVCILTEVRATIIDEIIELHERIPGSMFCRAKRQQAERLQKTGKLIQQKLRQYVSVGQASRFQQHGENLLWHTNSVQVVFRCDNPISRCLRP